MNDEVNRFVNGEWAIVNNSTLIVYYSPFTIAHSQLNHPHVIFLSLQSTSELLQTGRQQYHNLRL